MKLIRGLTIAGTAALLSGCNMVLMSPSGDMAVQQRDLIIWSTVLMLLVIVPVLFMTFFFAWRYRETNKDASYAPEWEHSTILELIVWSVPLAIIIALGALTWVYTHKLDPFEPLSRLAPGKPVPAGDKPLEIQVVSLDWKWLFIYPEQGIATVNEVAAPVDKQIRFKITSTTMMNSFFVPALAGQVYSMGGMQTALHAVINKPGEYKGFSANYSGAGFSDMKFKFYGMTDENFQQWVKKVRNSGDSLSRAAYQKLTLPSQNVPVHYYSGVAPNLYHDILNRCVDPGSMCMENMMNRANVKSDEGEHGSMEMHEGGGRMPVHAPAPGDQG